MNPVNSRHLGRYWKDRVLGLDAGIIMNLLLQV